MGVGSLQVRHRVGYVQARRHDRHAAAGERRQVRVRVPHDREDARLRLHGLREAMTRRARLGIFLIGLVATTATGCGDASRSTAPPPPAVVKVEPVVERDVPVPVEYVGTLVGSINAQIRARVAGHLVSQNYAEGSPVKAGDLLFQVDARPFQAAADQADARLNLAETQLSQAKAQVGASQAQVEQAIAKVVQDEAQVKQAEATQRQTELDVNRYTPLAQRGSVSQQELDNAVQSNLANLAAVAAARAAVLNSQASVSQARAALEKAGADVKTQEAGIAAARAALADARLNLGYTRVLSPIAGVAGFRGANIGDYIGPTDSTPLTTVSQVDPMYAEFPISEQRALAVLRRWAADPDERQRLALQLILADGTVYSQPGRAGDPPGRGDAPRRHGRHPHGQGRRAGWLAMDRDRGAEAG